MSADQVKDLVISLSNKLESVGVTSEEEGNSGDGGVLESNRRIPKKQKQRFALQCGTGDFP